MLKSRKNRETEREQCIRRHHLFYLEPRHVRHAVPVAADKREREREVSAPQAIHSVATLPSSPVGPVPLVVPDGRHVRHPGRERFKGKKT